MNNFSTRAKSVTPVTAATLNLIEVVAAVRRAIGGGAVAMNPTPFRASYMAEKTTIVACSTMTLEPSQVTRLEVELKKIQSQTAGDVRKYPTTFMEGGDSTRGFDVYAYIEGPLVGEDENAIAFVVQSVSSQGCVFVHQVSM